MMPMAASSALAAANYGESKTPGRRRAPFDFCVHGEARILAEAAVVQDKSESESLDLIWGAKNIATAINRTERETFHLLKKEKFPAKKVLGRWLSSREKLREYFLNELSV